MTRLSQIGVVAGKELRDALRDRRAVATLVLSSMFAPIFVGYMFNRMADRQRELDEITIPVTGAAYAPVLIDWLRQQYGVVVVDGPDDPEVAVRDRREDVVVVIAPDFARDFRVSRPAEVRIVADGSRRAAQPKVERVRRLLEQYNSQLGTLRLVARGVSPVIATPLRIREIEVSSAQQRAATILSFIPMFILLAAFTGGMQIAVDSTAGERERGSLEPLLVNPVPRGVLAGGKCLAASASAALAVLLTTGLLIAVLDRIPMQAFGIRFRLESGQIAAMLAVMMPMCILAAAIQMYLATFARSFKEAQSYMGLLIMVPMLPGIIGAIYPVSGQAWMYPVPILAQHVLIADIVAARNVPWWGFLLAAGTACAAALALVQLATGLLRRERIIFTR